MLYCIVLAVAASTATLAYGKQSKPPALFVEEFSRPGGQLPSQAFVGKSREVKINRGHLRSGRIMLSLPGGMNVGAVRDRQEEMGEGRFSWVGHAIGNRSERVVLGVSGDAVAGTFLRKGKLFKLEPRADGTHVLSEVSTSQPAPELEPVPVTETDLAPTLPAAGLTLGGASTASAGQVIIDVLVAYTPAVDAIYGTAGTEALIVQAVAETNQAYANSGINQRINLVSSMRTGYTESGDTSTDLSRLTDTDDGYMDEVHNLRDSIGADQVALLIKGGSYCGFAYRMATLSVGFDSRAFSVVRHDCATGYYSFAHELGHNQGAHHEPENGSGAIYEYAHGYQDSSNRFRTVMALRCSGCTRIDHFSNPDVLYNDVPTGDATESNNARTLNKTAATVASFRAGVQPEPPQAPYRLEASAAGANGIRLSWVDGSTDETGFFLERSGTNQNFVQIASVPANTVSYLDDSLQPDTLYYYRARSFNSAGSSNYSDTAITATDPSPASVPNAPSGLVAAATGTDSIVTSWVDNSDNESGFILEQKPSGSTVWKKIDLGPNITTYIDTGLSAGTLHSYRVRAYNDSGVSARTAAVSVQTEPLPASKLLRQRDRLN
jgi:hypothetical protein